MLFNPGLHDEKICIEWYLDTKGKAQKRFRVPGFKQEILSFYSKLNPKLLILDGILYPFRGRILVYALGGGRRCGGATLTGGCRIVFR